ncbi:MAG: DUF1854 domain-containing protein [Pirellula sp.]
MTANPSERTNSGTTIGVLAERARTDAIRSKEGTWKFQLSRDAWKHLVLTDGSGRSSTGGTVVPLCPVSTPQEWISILASEGDELVCLRDLESIGQEDRELIEQELAFREFVPQILRVLWVSGTQEPCEWEVETNFGRTKFVLNSEEDVRRVSAWTVHFVDASGGRFRVEDVRTLDSRSRAYVEWYV